jgi:hypothetical protein
LQEAADIFAGKAEESTVGEVVAGMPLSSAPKFVGYGGA